MNGLACRIVVGFSLARLLPVAVAGQMTPPAIKKVEIQPDRAFRVNDKPFFPLMAWLQDAKSFPAVRSCAMNAIAGYWPKSSGTRDVNEYLDLVQKAGFYGVMPFDAQLKGRPALLGYIHDDEPDLARRVSNAVVEPSKRLKINRRTPLWKLLDGDLTRGSVLDPLDRASLTVKLKEPVTVEGLAVALTVSPGLALAREVAFQANGAERLRETEATFTVQGLAAGSEVVVVDQNRVIRSGDGHFADTFAPLAVHIYRLAR